MSKPITLKVTQAKRGPTSRLTLAAVCHAEGEATSVPFVIDNLIQVCLKVKCNLYKRKHDISMLISKHKLAKNDTINVNVTCNALNFSKTCHEYELANEWTHIGTTEDSIILERAETTTFLSQTEIIITAYNVTTHPFQKLYDDSDFTDFTLSTADSDVHVHRACLAAYSPVFKTMFSGTWKETENNRMEIKSYTLQTVHQLKEFLYLGTLPDDGLRLLITLAVEYSVEDLMKECAKKLAVTVQPEDFYSLHELACANNIPALSYAITQLTDDNVVDECHQKKRTIELIFDCC